MRSVAAASGKLISTGMDYTALAQRIRTWGLELGFQAVGIADADLSRRSRGCWNGWGRAGMAKWSIWRGIAALRARPAELKPGTLRVISCRMDYAASPRERKSSLADGARAYIAKYARGRDYHKLLRHRCRALVRAHRAGRRSFGYRVFSDSAPVMGSGARGANPHRLRASIRCCSAARPARGFSWASLHRSGFTARFSGRGNTADRVKNASTYAPRKPSALRTGSTRGAASRT